MRSLILFLFITFFIFNANCQVKRVSGCVVNLNKEPIPYCNVYIKGTHIGTATNENGKYRLLYPTGSLTSGDSIVFSCIGYEMMKVPANSNFDTVLNVKLKSCSILLDEIYVSPKNIKEILRNSLKEIKAGYPTKPSLLTGVYQQILLQDDSIARIVEAAIDILIPSYIKDKGNQVRLLNVRSTIDSTKFVSSYPDKLNKVVRLMCLNNTIIPLVEHFDDYEFSYNGELPFQDSKLYLIEFKSKHADKINKSITGSMYIDVSNNAIVSLRIRAEKEINAQSNIILNNNPTKINLEFLAGEVRLDYKSYNGKYVISFFHGKDAFNLSIEGDTKKYHMQFINDFFVNKVDIDKTKKFKQEELINPNVDLSKQVGITDKSIWENFNRLIPVQLMPEP